MLCSDLVDDSEVFTSVLMSTSNCKTNNLNSFTFERYSYSK